MEMCLQMWCVSICVFILITLASLRLAILDTNTTKDLHTSAGLIWDQLLWGPLQHKLIQRLLYESLAFRIIFYAIWLSNDPHNILKAINTVWQVFTFDLSVYTSRKWIFTLIFSVLRQNPAIFVRHTKHFSLLIVLRLRLGSYKPVLKCSLWITLLLFSTKHTYIHIE